jgi:hypothetical protein
MTVDPPEQVVAVLAPLRPIAGEIIVAVDSRVDPAELEAYGAVADRVVRFEYRDPVDRPRTWLHAQCSGEWTFYLDGDEVPSAGLVTALERALEAEDVVQYWLPRRWLFGGASTWICELPWWPDFQLRVARRGSALGFRGGLHGGLAPLLPARHLDAPLYHLDLLLRSEAEREAKVAAYEAFQPSGLTHGGGRLNETMYLPERQALGELRAVPQEDRLLIDDVLAARTRSVAPGRPLSSAEPIEAPLVPSASLDALAPGRELSEDAYRVRLSLLDGTDRRFALGETRPVYVRVANLGPVWWSWGYEQEPRLRLTYRWLEPGGEPLGGDGILSPLTARIGPGDEQVQPVWVVAPGRAGPYRLEIVLLHEQVRRFPSPLSVDVVVADRPVRA